MTDLQSLLSRLEKAKEGNWRLDKAVSEKVVGRTYFGGRDQQYTRSVDAALSLVPEGWRAGFEMPGIHDIVQKVEAWCWPFDEYWEPDWQCGYEGYRSHPEGKRAVGETPSLALVVAALRARGA
jgi:hypothetical protein